MGGKGGHERDGMREAREDDQKRENRRTRMVETKKEKWMNEASKGRESKVEGTGGRERRRKRKERDEGAEGEREGGSRRKSY